MPRSRYYFGNGNRHKEGISRLAPEVRGKTFLLGQWSNNQEVPDPYQKSLGTFEHVYGLIAPNCVLWADRLDK
nr:hypothetical protein [Oceanisphaera sp. IT1-181]